MGDDKESLKRAQKRKSENPWTKPGTDQPEKRPGPFSQDPSRDPPTKEQRERDYRGKTSQS